MCRRLRSIENGFFALACTGILLLGAVINHLLPAGKFVAIPFVAPRGDDLQIRRERGGGEFEAHLVVALAGRAVGDGVGLFLLGDLDHALGDERPRDARAEESIGPRKSRRPESSDR